MITVKKDAIMYKDSDGKMQSAGVICNIGTLGKDWFKYAYSISNIFFQISFPEGSELNLCLDNITNMSQAFYRATGITKIILTASESEDPINMGSAFYGTDSSILETIDLSGFKKKPHSVSHGFRGCKQLKYILGELDFSAITASTYIGSVFLNCSSLEEVRFKKESLFVGISISSSPKLSDVSIQSIIDGLADITGQETQNLQLHKDTKVKLTEEQIATITSKNWTLA